MMSERTPAEVFPPGDLLAEELAERHWTADDLAVRSGLPLSTITAILDRTGRIDARTACALEDALGTSAALWANLDMSWRRRRRPGD